MILDWGRFPLDARLIIYFPVDSEDLARLLRDKYELSARLFANLQTRKDFKDIGVGVIKRAAHQRDANNIFSALFRTTLVQHSNRQISMEKRILITAIVRYRLPASISRDDCRAHFHKITSDFVGVPGLISKHFICAADGGVAGGVYQWESLEDAKAFYSGPWQKGIVDRYGMAPEIEFFEVYARTDNPSTTIDRF